MSIVGNFIQDWQDKRVAVKKCLVATAEIVCIVADDRESSYCVEGRRQAAGDRVRIPVADALRLERCGKAKIVAGSQSTEML